MLTNMALPWCSREYLTEFAHDLMEAAKEFTLAKT
jgi:hypothetical protein